MERSRFGLPAVCVCGGVHFHSRRRGGAAGRPGHLYLLVPMADGSCTRDSLSLLPLLDACLSWPFLARPAEHTETLHTRRKAAQDVPERHAANRQRPQEPDARTNTHSRWDKQRWRGTNSEPSPVVVRCGGSSCPRAAAAEGTGGRGADAASSLSLRLQVVATLAWCPQIWSRRRSVDVHTVGKEAHAPRPEELLVLHPERISGRAESKSQG